MRHMFTPKQRLRFSLFLMHEFQSFSCLCWHQMSLSTGSEMSYSLWGGVYSVHFQKVLTFAFALVFFLLSLVETFFKIWLKYWFSKERALAGCFQSNVGARCMKIANSTTTNNNFSPKNVVLSCHCVGGMMAATCLSYVGLCSPERL